LGRKALSVAEAKATLSDAIREVEAGRTVVITRHGKPVAALVRPDELNALERLRSAGPEGGLASIAGGWKGSEDLIAAVEARPRRGRRRVPSLD
jgi:prevent-host-death family protein